mgnify:CR=1 FL=1
MDLSDVKEKASGRRTPVVTTDSVLVPELFVGFGSPVFAVAAARLVSTPLAGALTVTVKSAEEPEKTVRGGHDTMLLAPKAPPLLALTNVALAGRKSCAMTLLASDGPKFDTMIE